MTETEIKNILSRTSRDCRILPDENDADLVRFFMTSCDKNMQDDAQAFEAWAIMLKLKYPKLKVIIDWGETKNNDHYRCFLYRIKCFKILFDWFDIHASKLQEYNKFLIDLASPKINNIGKGDADTKQNRNPEHNIEVAFNTSHKDVFLSKLSKQEILLTDVFSQLAVGIFNETVSTATRFFPGSKRAIDLWGLNTDGDLCIFELKEPENRKVGVISELMHYAFLVYNFFGDSLNTKTKQPSRGYNKLIERNKGANRAVNAYFLVATERANLNLNAVCDYLNSALIAKNIDIRFGLVIYTNEWHNANIQ